MHHKVILIVCVVILTASLLFATNEDSLYLFGVKWPMHCVLHKATGIKCALCGLSRSFVSLSHGRLRASIEYHPLGPVIFAFICLQIPYKICALKINPEIFKRTNFGFTVILIAAICINWLFYLGGLIT